MGTKYQRLLRRIKALEQMYKFSDEEKAMHRDLTWDLICDIILCPTGGDGSREMLTTYQKGKLLYLLATGEELEEGKKGKLLYLLATGEELEEGKNDED